MHDFRITILKERQVLSRYAINEPTARPTVTADIPRSENPFSSTSTSTTRMPINSPIDVASIR